MNTPFLVAELNKLGLQASIETKVPGFLLSGFEVQVGPHRGDVIDVAVAIDFPLTPPVGIHARAEYGTVGSNNISASTQMGDGWRYFSRRYEAWTASCTARDVLSYINRVLLDV